MIYVKLRRGTKSEYDALSTHIEGHDVFTLYVCEDTQQLFIGDDEYTKSVYLIDNVPTSNTKGNPNSLYIHNNSRRLWLCKSHNVENNTYEWSKIVLVDADGELSITSDNIIRHNTKFTSAKSAGSNTTSNLSYGSSFNVPKLNVNTYGHITSVEDVSLKLPAEVTYSIESTESGKIKLTNSKGGSTTITINGWSNKVDNTTTVNGHPLSSNVTVTKSDVGLGNVPNLATNDQTPTYTESSTLTNLTSGEKLSTAFGKISKAIRSFISHLTDSSAHTAIQNKITPYYALEILELTDDRIYGNLRYKNSNDKIIGEFFEFNTSDITYSTESETRCYVYVPKNFYDGDKHIYISKASDVIFSNIIAVAEVVLSTENKWTKFHMIGDNVLIVNNKIADHNIATDAHENRFSIMQSQINDKVPSGYVTGAIATHNTDTTAHADIRKDISDLKTNCDAAYQHSQLTSGNPHNVTKSDIGLSNVENKSSETIRSELTKQNVITALGYTPETGTTNAFLVVSPDSTSVNPSESYGFSNPYINLTDGISVLSSIQLAGNTSNTVVTGIHNSDIERINIDTYLPISVEQGVTDTYEFSGSEFYIYYVKIEKFVFCNLVDINNYTYDLSAIVPSIPLPYPNVKPCKIPVTTQDSSTLDTCITLGRTGILNIQNYGGSFTFNNITFSYYTN